MPAKLPPSFWEEESRRLVAVLLPHITALAMEGIQNGAAKVGITINYAIYSLLAEQWAREYTDQLLKNVRTTNEAVVGDILANWIAMPGRTIGDLRAALEPWFGTKRADVIAITEATRALASGELMAFQRAGVDEIRWGTNNDELVCPLCGPLHGVVHKIGEPFGYFKWRKNAAPEPVFVPPYHPNCRCGISPVIRVNKLAREHGLPDLLPWGNDMNGLLIKFTLAMLPPRFPWSAGDLAKHDGPGPHEGTGTSQDVHGGGGEGGEVGVQAYDDPEGFVADPKNQTLPEEMVNNIDGGPGASIQFHGSSVRVDTAKFKDSETYITPQWEEANGYAFGMHRMQNNPKGYRMTVRRKHGKTLNISDSIMEGFDAGLDPDEIISRVAPAARAAGFRYLYHDHPSFGENEVQHAIISLYPNEDLIVLKTSNVYNK